MFLRFQAFCNFLYSKLIPVPLQKFFNWAYIKLIGVFGFTRQFLANPQPSGEAAWARVRAMLQIAAFFLVIAAIVGFFLSILPTRGRVVLTEVELAGNVLAKLKNKPLTPSTLLQELLSQVRSRRSPRETLERVEKIIENLDFYDDLKSIMWIDPNIPYQHGSDFLPSSFRSQAGLFSSAPPFGGQLPGLDGEVKVFDSVSLKAGDLIRWYERIVLGRDLARLQIYSLGDGLVASVSTDSGRVWRVTERDVPCLKSGLRKCREKPSNFHNGIIQRLSGLIDALAQQMALTEGKPDLDQDWIGAAQAITSMRNLDNGIETSQLSLLENARKTGLLALQDPALSAKARYLTLLTLYATHFKALEFNVRGRKLIGFFLRNSCIELKSQATFHRYDEKSQQSLFDFFDQMSLFASESSPFATLETNLEANLARLSWHASIRVQLLRACQEQHIISDGYDSVEYDNFNEYSSDIESKISQLEKSTRPASEEVLWYKVFTQYIYAQSWADLLEKTLQGHPEILSNSLTNQKTKPRMALISNPLKLRLARSLLSKSMAHYSYIKVGNESKTLSSFAAMQQALLIYTVKDYFSGSRTLDFGTITEVNRVADVLNLLADFSQNGTLQDQYKITILAWLSRPGWIRWSKSTTSKLAINHHAWTRCTQIRSGDGAVGMVQIYNQHSDPEDFVKITGEFVFDFFAINENAARNRLDQNDLGNPSVRCRF
jgi:hypothetical protein